MAKFITLSTAKPGTDECNRSLYVRPEDIVRIEVTEDFLTRVTFRDGVSTIVDEDAESVTKMCGGF